MRNEFSFLSELNASARSASGAVGHERRLWMIECTRARAAIDGRLAPNLCRGGDYGVIPAMVLAAQLPSPWVSSENLRAMMANYALATTDGAVREQGGLTLVNSGVSFSAFNAALLSAPAVDRPADLQARLRAAQRYFHSERMPWSFWMPDEIVSAPVRESSSVAIRASGLRWVAQHEGMIAGDLREPVRELPPLEFRTHFHGRVRTARLLAGHHVGLGRLLGGARSVLRRHRAGGGRDRRIKRGHASQLSRPRFRRVDHASCLGRSAGGDRIAVLHSACDQSGPIPLPPDGLPVFDAARRLRLLVN